MKYVEQTKATTFAPSVKLPAPSVSIKSASTALASLAISTTSDQSVWLFMPTRTPATSFSPSAVFNSCRASVVRANEPEQMM